MAFSITSDGMAVASNNLIEGNYIGTDVTGTMALGNSVDGVELAASVGNAIGGAAAAGNLISANKGQGVDIQTGSNNNTIQGNPTAPTRRAPWRWATSAGASRSTVRTAT